MFSKKGSDVNRYVIDWQLVFRSGRLLRCSRAGTGRLVRCFSRCLADLPYLSYAINELLFGHLAPPPEKVKWSQKAYFLRSQVYTGQKKTRLKYKLNFGLQGKKKLNFRNVQK